MNRLVTRMFSYLLPSCFPRSFVYDSQLSVWIPSRTLQDSLTLLPSLPLPCHIAKPSTLDFFPPRPRDLIVCRYLFGGSFESPIDRAIDCTAEGFAYALYHTYTVSSKPPNTKMRGTGEREKYM